MTDLDIDKVLLDAADDTDRPLRTSIDHVVRVGRRRVLLRQSGGVAVSVLAVGTVALGAAQLADGRNAGSDPASGNGQTDTRRIEGTPTQRVVAPPPTVSSWTDAEIIRRCAVLDREFVRVSSNKAGGGTDPIHHWSVVIKQAPKRWVQALLVSPDGQRSAYCMFDTAGRYRDDYLREAVEVRPDYRVYTGGIDGSAGKLPADVARLTFETPDGAVSEARVKNGFFLWFHGRPLIDKPVWATFYDLAGRQLARFNAHPASGRALGDSSCTGTHPRCSLSR